LLVRGLIDRTPDLEERPEAALWFLGVLILIPKLDPGPILAFDPVVTSLPKTDDDFGLLAVFLAKTVSEDFIPRVNSAMLILASPSMSKRLRMAISSCFVATWPIERRNRFRLLLST